MGLFFFQLPSQTVPQTRIYLWLRFWLDHTKVWCHPDSWKRSQKSRTEAVASSNLCNTGNFWFKENICKLWSLQRGFPQGTGQSSLVCTYVFLNLCNRLINLQIDITLIFDNWVLIWKKTEEKSVPLVRGASFRSDFLQNPYFRLIIVSKV